MKSRSKILKKERSGAGVAFRLRRRASQAPAGPGPASSRHGRAPAPAPPSVTRPPAGSPPTFRCSFWRRRERSRGNRPGSMALNSDTALRMLGGGRKGCQRGPGPATPRHLGGTCSAPPRPRTAQLGPARRGSGARREQRRRSTGTSRSPARWAPPWLQRGPTPYGGLAGPSAAAPLSARAARTQRSTE